MFCPNGQTLPGTQQSGTLCPVKSWLLSSQPPRATPIVSEGFFGSVLSLTFKEITCELVSALQQNPTTSVVPMGKAPLNMSGNPYWPAEVASTLDERAQCYQFPVLLGEVLSLSTLIGNSGIGRSASSFGESLSVMAVHSLGVLQVLALSLINSASLLADGLPYTGR